MAMARKPTAMSSSCGLHSRRPAHWSMSLSPIATAKEYPLLIGRNLLVDTVIVDVSRKQRITK